MRGLLRQAFLGGAGAGAGWSVGRVLMSPRGLKALGVGLVLTVLGVQALWATHPGAVLLVGGTLLALLVMWLRRRFRWRVAPSPMARLPRTTGDLWWVYVLGEYRDREGRIIPLDELPSRRDAAYHLVYVGFTSDWEQRLRQHAADKTWFHDDLVIDMRSHWYASSDVALERERFLIRQAAASQWENDWPRENRQHNPRWAQDAARREWLNARAYAA